jgi:hypothetical protein
MSRFVGTTSAASPVDGDAVSAEVGPFEAVGVGATLTDEVGGVAGDAAVI